MLYFDLDILSLSFLANFLWNKRCGGTRIEQRLNGYRFWFATGRVEGNKHHGLQVVGFLHFLGLPVVWRPRMMMRLI
jgi:hypothetical protein